MPELTIRGVQSAHQALEAIGNLPADLQKQLHKFAGRQALRVKAAAVKRAPLGPRMGDPDYPTPKTKEYHAGALRQSAAVDVLSGGPARPVVATVSFGGRASDYAEVQHEEEEYWHPSMVAQKEGMRIRAGQSQPGQSHFLYGTDARMGPSAWEALRDDVQGKLEREVKRLARESLAGAAK